jgi:hypothetical protein
MAQGGSGVPFEKQPWYKKIFLLWTHEGAHHVSEKWIYGWALEPLVIIPLAFLILLVIAGNTDPAAVSGTLAMVVALSPIWLPVGLAVFFWVTWIHYIRYMFWFKQEYVLLEIQLPPEVEKSPLSMELFLTAMYNAGGESTFIARIWKGQFRPIFTLEIASNEGQVKFYLHCRRGWKNVLEARLYGQFPEARITEAADYVAPILFNTAEYGLWGAEFMKTAKTAAGHPADAMPIKTYIDYALDKSPDKPETQVDPISNLVEFLGQIGQGEYIWMQIVMRARKKDEWYGFYTSGDPWKKPAQEMIRDITNKAIERAQSFVEEDAEKKKVGSRGAMLLTGGEKLQVEAIERNLTKNVFECGIRVMYMARNENFNGVNIGNIVKFFDAYRQENYNNIMPTRGSSDFDYPWQDWNDIRQNRVRRNLFFRYKHRAYFFVPYDQVPTLLTTEELATIWHFPSSVVQTPALDRVPSRRSEAPINLPT